MAALTTDQIHQKVAAKFPEAVGPILAAKDPFCVVRTDRLVEVCQFLKSDPELAFDFLEDQTATDHPKENLIRLVLHFYSYKHRHLFKMKVELDRSKPEVDTLENVWKAANWMEREVYDLFGVNFKGHSDQRRIMMPDDWVGTPLRKDYVEAGGYQGISNIRDNPLDLYLNLDREVRAATSVPVAAPAAPTATTPTPAPAPKAS
jgi:NADH-quinone oxidoreductase subunit C